MAERGKGREFAEEILGRSWDNFASRVAASYLHDHYLHATIGEVGEKLRVKLVRMIPPEDLERVNNAHRRSHDRKK